MTRPCGCAAGRRSRSGSRSSRRPHRRAGGDPRAVAGGRLASALTTSGRSRTSVCTSSRTSPRPHTCSRRQRASSASSGSRSPRCGRGASRSPGSGAGPLSRGSPSARTSTSSSRGSRSSATGSCAGTTGRSSRTREPRDRPVPRRRARVLLLAGASSRWGGAARGGARRAVRARVAWGRLGARLLAARAPPPASRARAPLGLACVCLLARAALARSRSPRGRGRRRCGSAVGRRGAPPPWGCLGRRCAVRAPSRRRRRRAPAGGVLALVARRAAAARPRRSRASARRRAAARRRRAPASLARRRPRSPCRSLSSPRALVARGHPRARAHGAARLVSPSLCPATDGPARVELAVDSAAAASSAAVPALRRRARATWRRSTSSPAGRPGRASLEVSSAAHGSCPATRRQGRVSGFGFPYLAPPSVRRAVVRARSPRAPTANTAGASPRSGRARSCSSS